MSASVPVLCVDLAAVPSLEVKAWREDVVQRLGAGARLLTLSGRREGDDVRLTTVFRDEAGGLHVSRTVAQAHVGSHALTADVPAAHCFEREVHEQTGLRLAGHPWLKPVRFEGGEPATMNAYPFYRLEGKEVHEVAVGPIHAGVIEPAAFRFQCHGEQVHHLEIHLGYQHRGVEARLLEGDARRLAPLVETIAGDTSVAHTWAYCAALERLAGCELDLDAELARAAALELERVAMHLSGLAGLAADVGFLQGASSYGRLRTTAINTTMRLCGSRFGRGALRPGGLGLRLPPALVGEVRANLDLLQKDVALINECFLASRTVQHRLRGAGTLTAAQAGALGLVGLVARASGLAVDTRQGLSHGAYAVEPIAARGRSEGDCWARAYQRIEELDASLEWLQRVLARDPRWDGQRTPVGPLAPGQLAVAVVEGWRGEVVHCLETDAEGRLAHYKVQDPSLRNWMGLAQAVRGNEISDFPICNKSFDLSSCGHDL